MTRPGDLDEATAPGGEPQSAGYVPREQGAPISCECDWLLDRGFDLDAFLDEPLIARVAAIGGIGPSVRPLWYLWEDRAFWWLTARRARLGGIVARDPRVAVVIDKCNLDTGKILQVTARGRAEVLPFDPARAQRWGLRYLGADEDRWRRFIDNVSVFEDAASHFVRMRPTWLRALDLSF